MIAVDTNLLVYAHRGESPWHDASNRELRKLVEGRESWAIPWPCLHEFLAVVTNARIFRTPTPLDMALEAVQAWRQAATLVLVAETEGYWELFSRLAREGRIAGARIHDARVAALCQLHGVRELWSADRDFTRFRSLRVRNPLA